MVNHAKAWDWFRALALNQKPSSNHLGWGVEEEMGTSSICKHPGSTPKAPETGDLKEIWPFANYLYDP